MPFALFPAVNEPPSVTVGADQTVTLGVMVSLEGTVTDDGLPSGTLETMWSLFSGPDNVNFADASATDTTVSFPVAGVYVLRLTGDDGEFIDFDEVGVTVNPTPTAVTLLDEWVVDGSYGTQDASFVVSPGTNRLVLVALSAEKSRNGPMGVSSVSLGGQVLTEVFDFTVGSARGYHNLHWFGYLPESDIAAAALGGSGLRITYSNEPSNPLDEPKIHYASYQNVEQSMPIAALASRWAWASSLRVTDALAAGAGDKIVGFNVVGQHYSPGLSTAGYIEVTKSVGVTNGHASAVYVRTATASVSEKPTFTSSTAHRMAVSAVVLRKAQP